MEVQQGNSQQVNLF